jgi:hypothetical protein
MESPEKFEIWALVELFGHNKIVGKVTEQTIAGGALVRVDVPKPDGTVNFTRFFNLSAIYAINPISQEMAVEMAQRIGGDPVASYDVPQMTEKIRQSFVPRALPLQDASFETEEHDGREEY